MVANVLWLFTFHGCQRVMDVLCLVCTALVPELGRGVGGHGLAVDVAQADGGVHGAAHHPHRNDWGAQAGDQRDGPAQGSVAEAAHRARSKEQAVCARAGDPQGGAHITLEGETPPPNTPLFPSRGSIVGVEGIRPCRENGLVNVPGS